MLKKVRFIFVFISLSICLCFMSSTYSRYVADATGNIDVLFAKWQILVDDTDITNNSSSTISFVPVIEENANVSSNTIAPGSKGYFDIDIDPTNVEVSFSYTINLAMQNQNMPDIKITGYSIVPEGYVEGNPLDVITLQGNEITDTLNFDKGTEQFKFKAFTIRVYFEWYEGVNELMNDEADSNVGLLAATEGTTLAMSANISFAQIIE
ncbi:MAG: hypothetical protein ACM3O4_02830 [Ignavibacteriales bacterium]